MNKTRIKIANYLLFGPLGCATLVGVIWLLTKVKVDWKFGIGTAIAVWLILIGIFYWTGSKTKENGENTEETSTE